MQALRSISRLSIRSHIIGRTELSVTGSKYTGIFSTRNMSSSSTPTYTAEYLSNKIQRELNAEHVDVEDLSNCGCGMKFDAVIVSPQFEGKPILQRQRLVNQTLSEEMQHIHAFTMKTLTPTQWNDAKNKN